MLKQPRVVSNCTNGFSQLKNLLSSGGISFSKYCTRAIPLSIYCFWESRKQIPSIIFHFSGLSHICSQSGTFSSPSPRNTQSTNGVESKKSLLFPKNSGPPSMTLLLGSKALSLQIICNNISLLNSHAVAAIISGLHFAAFFTIMPIFSLIVQDTISHSISGLPFICA